MFYIFSCIYVLHFCLVKYVSLFFYDPCVMLRKEISPTKLWNYLPEFSFKILPFLCPTFNIYVYFFFFLMWLVLLLLCSPKGHIRNVRILFRLSPWLRKRCWYSMVRSQGCLPDSFRTQNSPQQRIPEFYLTLKCPTRSLYLTIAFCQQQSETKHLRSINKNGKGFNPLLLKLTVFKNNNTWVFGEILNVMYQGEFVD